MNATSPPRTFVLRNLPLSARLTLAGFLLSVGLGYVSALVQLHFQHATPGSLLPTPEDAERVFHGDRTRPVSTVERLLTADEKLAFSGSGQMVGAFLEKHSNDWKTAVKEKVKRLAGRARQAGPKVEAQARAELRKERDSEREAVVAWLRGGASKQDYQQDHFCLPDELAGQPVTDDFLVKDKEGNPETPRAVKIKSILDTRCSRCHAEGGDDANASQYPLDTYEHLKPYVTVQTNTGMSLTKLAQTTHVHLLGFSMLYGLTGLLLAFTSYPGLLRLVLAPLPLLAQVVEISFWWLARLDAPYGPRFAQAIAVSGAVVAVGLLLHIVLGLFDLFGTRGKLVLVALFVGAAAGGYYAKVRVIDPYIAGEKPAPAQATSPEGPTQ
jgi:hypothetical protein